ncbi:hypothetical protein H6758_02280 [Candidatus Nomurabacteria bacterium]|nr:hypothetical protein [Candidatus Nomurabacteria bacterium]
MFKDNVNRRITAVSVQLSHAEKKGISNVAKSSYYRAAIILLCTIIEGFVYQLVKRSTPKPKHVIDKAREYPIKHKIPAKSLGISTDLYICEKKEKEISIDDKGVTFGRLNLYLKDKSIISESQYKILDKVRTERNKIHLQSLESNDTGYTKKKFNELAKSLDFLLKKL